MNRSEIASKFIAKYGKEIGTSITNDMLDAFLLEINIIKEDHNNDKRAQLRDHWRNMIRWALRDGYGLYLSRSKGGACTICQPDTIKQLSNDRLDLLTRRAIRNNADVPRYESLCNVAKEQIPAIVSIVEQIREACRKEIAQIKKDHQQETKTLMDQQTKLINVIENFSKGGGGKTFQFPVNLVKGGKTD